MPYTDWDPYRTYVEPGKFDGLYSTGQFCLLAMGPPRLSAFGGSALLAGALSSSPETVDQVVYPLGLVQNLNVGQTRNFTRVFELGGDRSYMIPGRTAGQLGFGSVYYHGPSLLRRAYAYYQDLLGDVQVQALFPNIGATSMPNPHDIIVPPGYENIFMNLASDMFAQPIGAMLVLKDSNLQMLGAIYFEGVVIPNYNWATDANGVIIQETVTCQYDRILPVNVEALPVQPAVTGIPGSLS